MISKQSHVGISPAIRSRVILMAALSSAGSALAQPTITNLGRIPGGTETYALSLSADGTTAIGQAFAEANDFQCFLNKFAAGCS